MRAQSGRSAKAHHEALPPSTVCAQRNVPTTLSVGLDGAMYAWTKATSLRSEPKASKKYATPRSRKDGDGRNPA